VSAAAVPLREFASSNFLIPNGTLIVEVVAFLIILAVIGKYAVPALNKMLSERQEQIRSSLETAEAARAEAQETRAQRQGILDEARAQAREIITQANRAADRVKTEGEERGRQEYERIVSTAAPDIALARQRAIEDVSAQVAGLVLAVARQVVAKEIDAASHHGLIDEAIAALRSADSTASGSRA
jgi:F-type H+-transporting ATPase subunit b